MLDLHSIDTEINSFLTKNSHLDEATLTETIAIKYERTLERIREVTRVKEFTGQGLFQAGLINQAQRDVLLDAIAFILKKSKNLTATLHMIKSTNIFEFETRLLIKDQNLENPKLRVEVAINTILKEADFLYGIDHSWAAALLRPSVDVKFSRAFEKATLFDKPSLSSALTAVVVSLT